MELFTVTIAHPDGSLQTRMIAGENIEHVSEMCEHVGLEVLTVESTNPAEPAPEPADTPTPAPATEPTGRMYGKSAKGPRRNAAEMEQDRRIEELAKAAGFEFQPDEDYVADELEAHLSSGSGAEE